MVLITSCLLFSCWPAAWRIFGTRKIWMVSRRTTCRTKKRAGVTPARKKITVRSPPRRSEALQRCWGPPSGRADRGAEFRQSRGAEGARYTNQVRAAQVASWSVQADDELNSVLRSLLTSTTYSMTKYTFLQSWLIKRMMGKFPRLFLILV